jgi:DNA-binding NtrC family response regulator
MERVQSAATPDLLLLDLPAGDEDGLHILRWLRRLRPELPVILIGHPEDGSRKQEAIRMGAWDYLIRPFDESQLEMTIWHHLSQSREDFEPEITSDDVELVGEDNFFIGISPVMRKLRAQAALLAGANVPVLILGESGSGKETTGRLIHKLSVRSAFEFAKVNCAALPGELLERELFGYQRDGVSKPGKLELCEKGAILLNEITEMPMELQANLLQVLQQKRFTRPGTHTQVDVDVRVMASSTVNIERAISEKRLREDLYYRLSAYTIHVPPLRDRRDELTLLSRHFMHHLARHYGVAPRDFAPAILDACQTYAWPGNLRELENFVKRYMVAGDTELPFENLHADGNGKNHNSTNGHANLSSREAHLRDGGSGTDSLKSLIQGIKLEAEKNAIAAALEKTGWNRKAAARLLKVSYRTLLYKI